MDINDQVKEFLESLKNESTPVKGEGTPAYKVLEAGVESVVEGARQSIEANGGNVETLAAMMGVGIGIAIYENSPKIARDITDIISMPPEVIEKINDLIITNTFLENVDKMLNLLMDMKNEQRDS